MISRFCIVCGIALMAVGVLLAMPPQASRGDIWAGAACCWLSLPCFWLVKRTL